MSPLVRLPQFIREAIPAAFRHDVLMWRSFELDTEARVFDYLRICVVTVGTASWFSLPSPAASRPGVVAALLLLCWVYVSVLLARPVRVRTAERIPYVRAGIDYMAITAWVWATGGAESEYLGLFFAAVPVMSLQLPGMVPVLGVIAYVGAYVIVGEAWRHDPVGVFYLTLLGLFLSYHINLVRRHQRESLRDPLTACYGRAYGLLHLQRIMNAGKQFSLAILDLDGFKGVNDAYGHTGGDRLLAEFAWAVINRVRSDDLLIRYGGDEFVLTLPGLDGKLALAAVDALRAHIAETPLRVAESGETVRLTFSAGVVDGREGPDPMAILKLADRRLYSAKDGRNRVVFETGECGSADEVRLAGVPTPYEGQPEAHS